jgi:hypothetical protein
MARPFVESIDSSDLEGRFSTDDRLIYIGETPIEDLAGEYERLEPYFARLPKREQDLLFMHFIMRKKQTELGIIFNRTQAAISYRIKKAIRRLQFLLSLPPVDEEMIRKDLSIIFSQHDIEIMCGMFKHTCQTQVAKDLGSNQCFIRHRFHKNIKILERKAEEEATYAKYYTLFVKIRDNTNILREVKLSRWDKGDYIVDEVG